MVHILVFILFTIICCAILFSYQMYGYMFLVLLSLSFLCVYRIVYVEKRPVLISFIICISSFLLFFHIIHLVLNGERIYNEGFAPLQDNTFGIVSEFPSYRFSNNQYIISIDNSNTKILVYTQPYQKFLYKQKVNLSGKFKDIREETEWYTYYRNLGVHYVSFYPSVETFNIPNPLSFFEYLKSNIFSFKLFIRQKVLEKFSSYTSTLVLGMLLGEKDELSKEEKDLFNGVGISHILVVSGYNISLVISLFFIIFAYATRFLRVILSVCMIGLFVVLVGADDSVVRAAIMGSILIFAQLFHKKSSSVNVLFIAAIIMLYIKPITLFDIGFHLSFLATFAILTMPKIKEIPEYIFTILWIFLYMSVYTVYLSEKISVIGIISNIGVLFIVPFFMLTSAASIFFSIVPLDLIVDHFLLEICTRYIFLFNSLIYRIPFIEYKISPHGVVVIYVVVLSFVLFLNNRYTTKQFIEKHYQKFVPQNSN